MAFYRCMPTSVKRIPKPIYGDFVFNAGWKIGDRPPAENGFEYGGDKLITIDSDGAVMMQCKKTSYSAIIPIARNGGHQLLEVSICVNDTSANGVRMLAGTGKDGTGIQITINGGYLNVLECGAPLDSISCTANFSYNEYHTVAVGIDYEKNDNRVYLDGQLIRRVDNSSLSNQFAASCWVGIQEGKCKVSSIRHFI